MGTICRTIWCATCATKLGIPFVSLKTDSGAVRWGYVLLPFLTCDCCRGRLMRHDIAAGISTYNSPRRLLGMGGGVPVWRRQRRPCPRGGRAMSRRRGLASLMGRSNREAAANDARDIDWKKGPAGAARIGPAARFPRRLASRRPHSRDDREGRIEEPSSLKTRARTRVHGRSAPRARVPSRLGGRVQAPLRRWLARISGRISGGEVSCVVEHRIFRRRMIESCHLSCPTASSCSSIRSCGVGA